MRTECPYKVLPGLTIILWAKKSGKEEEAEGDPPPSPPPSWASSPCDAQEETGYFDSAARVTKSGPRFGRNWVEARFIIIM